MTVKSPFYNKPSTSTSVDSCHKCPLILNFQPMNDINKQQQDQSTLPAAVTGFDQAKISTPSNNNNSSFIEPSNSCVAKSDIGSAVVTSCSNCGTTTTPLWRRSPVGETICNACGLYFKARNTTRPVWLKRNASKRPKSTCSPIALAPRISPTPLLAPATHHTSVQPPLSTTKTTLPLQQTKPPHVSLSPSQPSSPSQPNISKDTDTSSLVCANCQTTNTPLWRRDESGLPICNACGLYFKLHSVHRPMTMKRSTIKRRKRVTAASIVTHKPVMIHQHVLAPSIKRPMEAEIVERPNKRTDHLRPLLPCPTSTPISSRKSSPDPIEPDVFPHRYLPSPPMRPTSNIACLLNPEVDRLDRSLPSLPSPPLVPHDDFALFHTSTNAAAAAATQKVLEAHRIELKREVTNLTSLLSRTTAMLQNIDSVIAHS
ncbi:hypothetical protein BD770DRAFT_378183 [Pilaira anomala]|nr:hypothetical protein BD770DRAFT_378183 [Pilaira anomala]